MLVLENSKFADKVPFADGQKTGARFWVDMLAATKDWFGLVGGDGSVLFSLQILETPDDIRRALAAIDSVEFAAAPNTPAALRTSLEEITPDGVLAQIQSTVLVTASNPNAPPASPVDAQLFAVAIPTCLPSTSVPLPTASPCLNWHKAPRAILWGSLANWIPRKLVSHCSPS